jgi:hypothetical protein
MRDVNFALRSAYYQNLTPLLGSYPIYDEITVDFQSLGRDFLFVILGAHMDNDSPRTKTTIIHDASIMVNIYYGAMGTGGKSQYEEVAQVICDSVIPSNGRFYDLSSSSLQIITAEKVWDVTQFLPTTSHKVWMRSMRFRHKISEI